MKLAVNYSPQAAELVSSKDIPLELFKCPDWPDLIAQAASLSPVYVHFPLVAGNASLLETDWSRVESLLGQTDTAFVNVHLEVTADDMPGIPVNSRDPGHAEQVAERLVSDVELVARHFGPDRVIAENVIYRGLKRRVLRPVVLPEVIRTVIMETGCGFLLDLSHARISAHYLEVEEAGVGLWDYLEALPVEHLRELHVTGIQYRNEKIADHLPLTEDDWGITGQVLERIHRGAWARPRVVAFEYGGVGPIFEWRSKKEVLAEQLPRLYELVHGTDDGVVSGLD